ncbi:MAG: hypothetical protein RLZZ502_945 [Pseudomonadota bacterium]|jgi:MoxR-like ATPase
MTAPDTFAPAIAQALSTLNTLIYGKQDKLKLALACLLAQGHLLIEDLPGVGKSTLAQALAKVLGLSYKRVQGSNDLLPADILGYTQWQAQEQKLQFQTGPIFTEVLLMDELNRTSSKTQSALLEAMEERQVSVEGVSRALPKPFFVIATQNPLEQVGTYALPESQLDRFMMRLSLGLPSPEDERALLKGGDTRARIGQATVACNPEMITAMQMQIANLHVSELLLDYVQRLLTASRHSQALGNSTHSLPRAHGLSPRAGLALLRAAQAHAYVSQRQHVLPDDVQAVFGAVTAHRLHAHDRFLGEKMAQDLINSTAVVW